MTFLALIVLATFACIKSTDEVSPNGLTPCLESKIEEFKAYNFSVSVLTTVNNGERVYKFRTIEMCGTGEIVNENCDVVCCAGKCTGPRTNCPTLDFSEWEVIWEK